MAELLTVQGAKATSSRHENELYHTVDPHMHMIWCFGEIIVFPTPELLKLNALAYVAHFNVNLEKFTKIRHFQVYLNMWQILT